MRAWVSALVIVTLIASLALVAVYKSAMSLAHERIRGKSTVISSPYGEIEYSEGGAGVDVLIVHGAGGGFDQGELIAQGVLDDRFHWIAPSRFGYLRSTFNVGATYDDQARAYTWLLNHLGIEKVAVVAMSAGGPSALLLAVLPPERVSSLTLLSAGVTTVTTEDQAQANQKGKMWVRIFGNDFLYWITTRLFKKQVMELMGADEGVIADLSTEQRDWAERVIDYINPVSRRFAGAVVDNTFALPGGRIAAIKAPTLIVHAQDDTLQLYDNAVFAAATIPGARLLPFARGGHFVMIVQQATVREAVQNHILDNASTSQTERQ